MVCLPLIAEQNAHEICLTQECLQIVRHLLWNQTTTHSIRNNNPMFDGNLLLNLYGRLSILTEPQLILQPFNATHQHRGVEAALRDRADRGAHLLRPRLATLGVHGEKMREHIDAPPHTFTMLTLPFTLSSSTPL